MKRICEVISPWPLNSGWAASFRGTDKLAPDLTKAVVQDAYADKAGVVITVAEGGHQFSTIMLLNDANLGRKVVKALSFVRGRSLDQAGEQLVED